MSYLQNLVKDSISTEAASLDIEQLKLKLTALKETKASLEKYDQKSVLASLTVSQIKESLGLEADANLLGHLNKEIVNTEKSIKLYNSVNK